MLLNFLSGPQSSSVTCKHKSSPTLMYLQSQGSPLGLTANKLLEVIVLEKVFPKAYILLHVIKYVSI